jgi:aryl-alcohol dehydrogenase-like predicted oxidoreductase
MTSVIIGATTMEQLKHDIDAFDSAWSDEIEAAVTDVHASTPNPCP